jgi:hypothetical protein
MVSEMSVVIVKIASTQGTATPQAYVTRLESLRSQKELGKNM